MSDEGFEAFHKRYSDPALDEKGAMRLLMNEVVSMVMQSVPQHLAQNPAFLTRLVNHRPLLDASVKHFKTVSDYEKTVSTIRSEVEASWKEALPNVPAKFLWQYGMEAEQLHPGDIPKQALHCVQRVLEDLGPALTGVAETSKVTEGIQRGQGPVLPGGSGLPAAGAAGGPPSSFVDQMQRANQGL